MRDEPTDRTFFLYSTVCSIIVCDGGAETDEILDEAQEMAFQIRRILDFYDEESEFDRLSRGHMTGVPYEVSEELCRSLVELLELSRLSEGCFDPTVGPVIWPWSVTARSPKKPLKEEIERVRSRTGVEYVNCDTRKKTVTLERDRMMMDAGGAGKKYTMDRVVECLKSRGVRSASADFGGDLYLIRPRRSAEGQTAGGETGTESSVVKVDSVDMVEAPWKVEIRAPWSRETRSIGAIELQGCGTVTSGDYDQYFSEDEKIYHHLLNPRTGYPVDSMLGSMTIVSDSTLYTDLLSTACLAAGEDAVDKICKRVGGRVDCVLVKKDGTITVSDGLRTHFKRNDS